MQKSNNKAGAEQALIFLGRISLQNGKYSDAEAYFHEAHEIAGKVSNREIEARVLNNIGLLFSHQQKYSQAKEYFDQALHLYQEIGSREGEASALNNLGIIGHVLGQYDTAYFYYEQSLFISREVGAQQDEAIALNNLGEVLAKQQKHTEAETYFTNALIIEKETGARYLEAHTSTMLGFSFLELNKTTKAEIAFLKALSLRNELGQLHLTTLPQVGLACVNHTQERYEKMKEQLNTILDNLDSAKLDGLEDPLNTFWLCFKLLEATNDNRALTLLQKTHQFLLAQGAKIPDLESRQSFLNNVPEHRLILETFELYTVPGSAN